jgi:hypothetical protein
MDHCTVKINVYVSFTLSTRNYFDFHAVASRGRDGKIGVRDRTLRGAKLTSINPQRHNYTVYATSAHIPLPVGMWCSHQGEQLGRAIHTNTCKQRK